MKKDIETGPVRLGAGAPGSSVGDAELGIDPRRAAMVGPRWKFLAEASAILDASLEYKETLVNVVKLVVPTIADYAIVVMRADDRSLTWGSATHTDPDRVQLVHQLREYVPSGETGRHPAAEAVRSGTTQVVNTIDDDYLRSVAKDDIHLALLRELAPTSYIVIPLGARGTTFGSLLMATTKDSGRRYTHRDVAIANEVGRRIASAVDRALLYRAAMEAGRAREKMVAVVSHDLKNPISTIQMAVTFLLEIVVPDDEAHAAERKHLGAIRRSTEGMYRLIHDLLDLAAFEAGQLHIAPSPTPIEVLLNDAVELLSPLATGKGVELISDIPSDLPPVDADRARVIQVFSNIGGNAIKFTPEGGRVVLSAAPRGSAVEFSVCDTGPGIPAEDLPHIFDRYWQANKKAHVGSGLGLAIAKGIVKGHGGEIRAESNPGRGSCLAFTLRVAPPQLQPIEVAQDISMRKTP